MLEGYCKNQEFTADKQLLGTKVGNSSYTKINTKIEATSRCAGNKPYC